LSAHKIALVLAIGPRLAREALKVRLDTEADLDVRGEASDAAQIDEQLERDEPNVLLLDPAVVGATWVDFIRERVKRHPATKVVVLASDPSLPVVVEALRAGALAFVVKSASTGDLVTAIRRATQGRRYVSPPLTVEAVAGQIRRARAGSDPYERLTPRERQVLRLTVDGWSSTAVASKLGISPRTVETHRANLMRKLGLRRRTELVRYAMRRGLVPNDVGDQPTKARESDARSPKKTSS
jgi:DNA-binding NarL/FixJ family response regulator